jgi:hypothetical protein
MPEIKQLGNVTYRKVNNEEARGEFCSSFVFVGPAKPTTEARELLKKADAALKQLHEMHKAKGAEQP